MARHQYRCEKCGNTIPAERIEKRVQGTKGPARVLLPVLCENREHGGQFEMLREEYTPPRREVRID